MLIIKLIVRLQKHRIKVHHQNNCIDTLASILSKHDRIELIHYFQEKRVLENDALTTLTRFINPTQWSSQRHFPELEIPTKNDLNSVLTMSTGQVYLLSQSLNEAGLSESDPK